MTTDSAPSRGTWQLSVMLSGWWQTHPSRCWKEVVMVEGDSGGGGGGGGR